MSTLVSAADNVKTMQEMVKDLPCGDLIVDSHLSEIWVDARTKATDNLNALIEQYKTNPTDDNLKIFKNVHEDYSSLLSEISDNMDSLQYNLGEFESAVEEYSPSNVAESAA